ncbi:MAG: helix-turn-helix transcriptional regulator [Acaryochloridaceae cyanobacterium CSU_3_4]|nr:helix-turn-helix transcriptional regulator [Acaryochloridaceae cyanobacterium CSU_3_4]
MDPSEQSQGYRKSIDLSSSLNVLIDHYNLQEDLLVTANSAPNAAEALEFELSFMIQGHNQSEKISAGQNFLLADRDEGGKTYFEWAAGQRVAKLDIHFDLDWIQMLVADSVTLLPPILQQALDHQAPFERCLSLTSPAMQNAISQILHCPYQGLTQRLYLESKAQELVALRLDQMMATNHAVCSEKKLSSDDIERIHYAKELLLNSMNSPTSLMELARQAGLNDYKLKIGFRQVFGTTVFGYLHNHRLELAQALLAQGDLKVTDVATAIGFASRSHFSTAFHQRFGMTPKGYQMQFR